MPIPAGGISTLNLDATTDSPASARVELLAAVTQFNQLIASANGVTGMAVLDASGFLAGYGRLSAAQSWSGVNTFTVSAPILLSAVTPYVRWRDSGQALPNGAWAIQAYGGGFRVIRNTAAAGDFSTVSSPFLISNADAVSFSSTVAGANAVAAGDFVNKGQLDARTRYVLVANNGTTASITYGPAGWSVTRNSTGVVTVTHTIGSTNYSAVSCVDSFTGYAVTNLTTRTATTTVVTTLNTSGVPADLGFSLIIGSN